MSTDDTLPADYAIPIIPASELDHARAWRDFYKPNLPFIVTGLTDDWPARRNWVKHVRASTKPTNDAGDVREAGRSDCAASGVSVKAPDWDYLEEQYGHFEVSVLQCAVPASTSVQNAQECDPERSASQDLVRDTAVSAKAEDDELRGYGQGDVREMLFKDVIGLWKRGKGNGLYIKDWHLRRELRDEQQSRAATADEHDLASSSFPCATGASTTIDQAAPAPSPSEITQDGAGNDKAGETAFYTTPNIFKDDWMDHYYSNETQDDFAFVYFGTKGTFTPLHRDVYTSYSWSANILGRKRWHFVPPSSVPYCRVHPSSSTSALHPDIRPGAINTMTHASFLKARIFAIDQPEGSIIYVPSDWHHCVENLDQFVISINQNWGNSGNLESMYTSMQLAASETEKALADVRQVLERRKKQVLGIKQRSTGAARHNNGCSAAKSVARREEPEKGDSDAKEGDEADEKEEEEFDMEREWDEIVQQVLEQNVGWGWKTFYAMIEHNLLHPPAPPSLSPPEEHLTKVLSSIFGFQDTNNAPHEEQAPANALGNEMESLHLKDEPADQQGNVMKGNGLNEARRPWSDVYTRSKRAAEAVISGLQDAKGRGRIGS